MINFNTKSVAPPMFNTDTHTHTHIFRNLKGVVKSTYFPLAPLYLTVLFLPCPLLTHWCICKPVNMMVSNEKKLFRLKAFLGCPSSEKRESMSGNCLVWEDACKAVEITLNQAVKACAKEPKCTFI